MTCPIVFNKNFIYVLECLTKLCENEEELECMLLLTIKLAPTDPPIVPERLRKLIKDDCKYSFKLKELVKNTL